VSGSALPEEARVARAIVFLLSLGLPHERIVCLLGVSWETVQAVSVSHEGAAREQKRAMAAKLAFLLNVVVPRILSQGGQG
jgi:hypothetical protein